MELSKIEFGASMKKECFHFEEGFTYVNHGAYGEVPLKIRDKQQQLLDAQNDNTGAFFRETTPRMYMTAIDAAAKFLGADPANLVFVQNATTGEDNEHNSYKQYKIESWANTDPWIYERWDQVSRMSKHPLLTGHTHCEPYILIRVSTVLKSFPWQKGDEILASVYTYKAVEYACRRVAEFSTGGQIHQFDVRFPIKDELEVINSMTSHLDKHPRVRLVVIDHITSPTALMFPIKRMILECRKRGVWVLIDGAHAPGQVDIKLEELSPDFYVGNFHKWMYTPRGCGVIWVRKEHHDWCTPLVTSHMYKKGFQMEFFVQGTRDDIPYFLIPDSIQFHQDVGGREKINKYSKTLLDKASVLIAERLNTEVLQIPKSMEAPGMRLVLLPEFEGYEKTWEGSERLFLDITKEHRLNCAIYPAQGELYLRLSANIYNEMTDYEKTADLLRQLSKKK